MRHLRIVLAIPALIFLGGADGGGCLAEDKSGQSTCANTDMSACKQPEGKKVGHKMDNR